LDFSQLVIYTLAVVLHITDSLGTLSCGLLISLLLGSFGLLLSLEVENDLKE